MKLGLGVGLGSGLGSRRPTAAPPTGAVGCSQYPERRVSTCRRELAPGYQRYRGNRLGTPLRGKGVLAYPALGALQPGTGERAAKRNVVEAIRQTADRLGNTPSVARGSYVHPAVLEAYLEGSIRGALVEAAEEQETPPIGATRDEEAAVRALLRQRLEDDAARGEPARGDGRGNRAARAPRRRRDGAARQAAAS